MKRTGRDACARVGDVLVIHPHHVGEPERSAEILEILGDPGREHFRVRWDDDHESIFYPGGDAIVHRRTKEVARVDAGPEK
jgi:hypothetical protein